MEKGMERRRNGSGEELIGLYSNIGNGIKDIESLFTKSTELNIEFTIFFRGLDNSKSNSAGFW